MFHWKLMIAIIILIVFLCINKREYFDDISRNILIDKSLTNVNGKTLIELANDNIQNSTLGYINGMYTEFTNYPTYQQQLEKEKFNYTELQNTYQRMIYDLSNVRLSLSDLSSNIGKCIQKYYTDGNGTPQADPKDFEMFKLFKYDDITIIDFIEILKRLRKSFARTMNAINIHNYNIEKAYPNGLVKMRMDIFNSLIGKYSISATNYVGCCNQNKYITTNYSALTYTSAFRASRYSMNEQYEYTQLYFIHTATATYHNHTGNDEWTDLRTAYSTNANGYDDGNFSGGPALTSPWRNATFSEDDKKYAQTLSEQSIGYNWLFSKGNNNVLFSYFGMETTYVSLLDKYMNMAKWKGGNVFDIRDVGFIYNPKNNPKLLNSPVVITVSNYTTASYYNIISIDTKVFEDLILKYNTVFYDDFISLNLNATPMSYTAWLSDYYYKNRVVSWKEEANIDHGGNDLGGGTGSLEEVKALCENSVPECKGFNWNPTTKQYWYKHTLGVSVPLQGYNFYTKDKDTFYTKVKEY